MSPRGAPEVFDGRYEVEGEVGAGGMGTVYRARDLRLGRAVAIKVLNADISTNVNAKRFHREVAVTAGFHHPGIVPLFDSGECEDRLYYVMPFVEGPTLAARLRQERQLTLEESIRITCQVAGALSYAHERGVVHRDVKPSNIMFGGAGALLADFGIARLMGQSSESVLTGIGRVLGTPGYMSPEQMMSVEVVDGRSDQYSLACVLFEMLAGELPYTGTNVQSILAKQLRSPVPSVRTTRATVTKQIDSTIAKCLSVTPADRFTTMEDVIQALHGFGRPSGGNNQLTDAAPKRSGMRSRFAAISANRIVLLAFGLLLTVVLLNVFLKKGTVGVPEDELPVTVALVAQFQLRSSPDHVRRIVELLATQLRWVTDAVVLESQNVPDPNSPVDVVTSLESQSARGVVNIEVREEGEATEVVIDVRDPRRGSTILHRRIQIDRRREEEQLGPLVMEIVGALANVASLPLGPGAAFSGSTKSPQAVRGVLGGIRLLAAQDPDGAASLLERAVAADSAFAEAAFWLSVAEDWGPRWQREQALRVIDRALNHASVMNDNQVKLLSAQRAYILRYSASIQHFQDLLRDNPGLIEASFGLGESLYYFGGFSGHRREESLLPYTRVDDAYGPLAPVYLHLADVALLTQPKSLASTYVDLIPQNDPFRSIYAAAFALRFGSESERERAFTELQFADYRTVSLLIGHLALDSAGWALADSVAGVLAGRTRTLEENVRSVQYRLATGHVGGSWVEALAAWRETTKPQRFDRWIVAAHVSGLDVEGESSESFRRAIDLIVAQRVLDFGLPVTHEVRQAFRGLVHRSFVSGDSSEVVRLITLLQRALRTGQMSDPLPTSLLAVLRARLDILAADTSEALTHLEQALDRVAEPYLLNYPLTAFGPQRAALACWYSMAGQDAQARYWVQSFRTTNSVGDLFYHYNPQINQDLCLQPKI